MQENNFEQPPSLSQLLRESYLAEARAQQRRGEMSHSDSASSRFQVFLPLKGKGEDAGGQNDSQFPDLSAFLSQEELDKSVNLAQQAIGKKPQEVEVKASASPLTTSNSSSSSVLSSAPPSVVLNTQPMGLFSDASTEPSMEVQKTAGTHSRFTSERKMHKSLARQDGLNRNIRDSAEEFNDRHVKGAPYNLETQSKKEFLNKAADFIEELSSLFKANSSKRVRPRACKAHRTRAPSKGQNEETGCPLSSEDRERAVMPVEVEKKRCSPPVSHLPTVLQDPECAQTEVQKCRSKEEPDEAVSQKAEEQAECLASTETPFQSETVCEPPRFIQKLKSREVLEGTKVQLDCIVAGHPAPEVRWFCEGKELENSPDIQILSSGQLHSLIIAEAFEEDTGRYSCFASNFCGTDSTSAEIYVEGASSSDSDVEQLFDHVPQLQRKPYKASVCRPSVSPARPTVENKLEAATEEPAEELSTPLTTQTTPQSVPAQIPTELTPVPDHSETSAALPLATEPPVLSVQLSSSSSGVPAEESSIPALSAAPTETSGPLNTVVSSVQPVLLHPTLTETSGPLNLVVSSVQPVLLHPAPTETSGPLNPVVSSVQPVLLLPGTTETSGPLYPMVSSVLHSAPTETSEPLNPVVSSVQSVLLHPPPTKISGPLNPVVSTVQPLLFHPSLTETSGPLQPVVSSVQPVLLLSTQTETSGPLNPVVSSVQPVLFHPAPTAQLPSSVPNHSSQQASDVPLVMAAPVFTKSLQDFTASQGQLVVLECRVKGAPSPQVDWFREGKLLEDSPDYRILQKKPRSPAESEEICTLVIAEVFAEDSGMFTCTASNKYGTVSSSAALKVKGDGSNITHIRPLSSSLLEPGRVPEAPTPLVKTQPEISVSSSIKPHSSTISLDPLVSSTLRLDPLSISHLHLEPHSYTTSRPDPHRTSLPISSSATNLEPGSVNQEPFGFSRAHQGGLSGKKIFPHPKPGSSFPAAETSSEQGGSRPSETLLVKKTSKNQNQSSTVVSLPDPPPNSCLKTGTMTNHKDPRSGSRVGLRVHFKLPEDEEYGSSSDSEEDVLLASAGKEPPPVRAKPKLDPSQLQLLHNQVLMEQQQESESQPRTSSRPPPPSLLQPEVQSAQESSLWPPRMQREPQVPVFQSFVSSAQQISGPPPTTSTPASALTTAPTLTTTVLPPFKPSPAPPMSFLHTPHAKTLPPPVPLLSSAPALSTPLPGQSSTIHASHLNLSPAALSRTAFSSPPAPKLSILPTDLNAQQITSPAAVLRSAHASLMNLTSISSTFNYARPKEFIAAQAQSPIMSPSPTESPVPLLQELAAELNSSAASSPIPPPFSPPLRLSPTRVLKSPTSPPSLVSSPTPGSFLNSMSFLRAQSPPQASSPTSSSSSPSPIQNPVAFLSSVLPSLTPSQPTNAMGLPKGAPRGVQKKTPKVRLPSAENIRESKELLLLDLEKLRLKDSAPKAEYLQKRSVKGETASRLLGPNIPATVFNYDEEYKVSNFEQRLMSEIEFRLERTPVEESDEEVQHDDVPSGRCIAPIFDKKLKNFKAVEGVPVTFSCKVVGVPPPKVYWFKDGKQILRKNTHYKKMREGDGTCALHIESTTSDDDGNYTVMVANPQGRISCSGHLIVQTGPPRHRLAPLHPQRVRSRVQEVEGEQTQERFFRPHFLQAPGDMMAHEGRLCRLDCKVSGLPNPELMWLVNGKPIYPDLTHKMLVRENSVHSLVIDPLMQNDEGTYTCIASNKAGQSSFSLELKVVEKETKHAPQFVEKLQNMGIPEGSPVRLECRVVGMPPPAIFWKKDNETVSKTKDRISMTQDATGYVCLLIQTTTKDDAGWYTVSAKNEAGIISCTCRLDIYAQWHQSVPPPMRKTPRTGSRYAALTGQGLDIKAAFPTSDTSPILFASSPPEATLESEEL